GAGRTAAAGGGAGGVGATNDDDAGAVMPKAGSGGTTEPQAGSAGTMMPTAGTVAMPTAGTVAMPRMDLGKGDGRDVITIGDSWMNNTLLTGTAIEGALDRLTMQPYRHYAVQGVLLLQASAFGPAIPSQYATAKRQDPDIKTVLMTGGGNDIIQNASVQSSCSSGGEACKMKLMEISNALNELWTQMAADGVQDVVLIRYSDDAGSTDPTVRMMATTPPAICTSGKIHCHSIASTEAVMGDLQDGIHPTRAANDRLAKVIWDYLVKNGIRR
ncbi:MAG TPA: hypothetical protein VJV78_09725, partial [Polyangiales bacterium]|nr:hypothetical protein [Polyangiales bacterium]